MNIEKEQTKLLDKHGVIFAFSNEQFDEQKQKGVKYVSLGAGMLCPKEAVKSFVTEHKQLIKEGREREQQEKTKEQIIEEALANYECYYLYNIEDAAEVLQDYGYTSEQIWDVFHKTKHKYDL